MIVKSRFSLRNSGDFDLLQHHHSLDNGGKIHIKPSHRGLFTAKANAAGEGVQEYASHVLANKGSYDPATVKQANFARNFGGSKAKGGKLGDTQLHNPAGAANDLAFRDWYTHNTLEGRTGIPFDGSGDYDYYSYYKNTLKSQLSNPDAHFPDTYKYTNHNTFSNESAYSTPENVGGRWVNGRFIPEDMNMPVKPKANPGAAQGAAAGKFAGKVPPRGMNSKLFDYQNTSLLDKKAEGGVLDPTIGNNAGITKDQVAQIRRMGETPGWEPVAGGAPGTVTLRRSTGLGAYFRPGSANPNDSVSSYDLNDTNDFSTLPHVGARRTAAQFLQTNPEVNNLKYGEVDYSRIPGYAGNNSGIANGVYQFNQSVRDIPVTKQVTPLDTHMELPVINISQNKPKDFVPSMYTPDHQSMGQFIDSIRKRTADTNRYNAIVKKKSMGGKLSMKQLVNGSR